MNRLSVILMISIISCGKSSQESMQKRPHQKLVASIPLIGEKIQGDFDGDGITDYAEAVKIREGHGNPVEDGTPDEYEIRFSAKHKETFKAGCCEILLINEGDLNGDGADEISVFQAPMNGCTFSMTAWTYQNRNWQKVVDTFLIPTGCNNIEDAQLQGRIRKQNGKVYYYETDPNDENGNLIRKKTNL